MERGTGRVGAGLKTVGRIFSIALLQAQQSESIVLARRRFRDIYEAKEKGNDGFALEGEAGDAGEEITSHEEEIGHSLADQGQLVDSFLGGR